MKRIVSLLLVLIMLMLSACGTINTSIDSQMVGTSGTSETNGVAEPKTRSVTDMAGQEVILPVEVNRYVESWAAHTTIDLLLDNLEGLTASSVPAATSPSWIYLISENMNRVKPLEFSENMNLEEVIAQYPDVVFGNVEGYREMFETVNIPYVNVDFYSYETMVESIQLTAEILGGTAVNNAEKYIEYLNERKDWVSDRVATLSEEDRVSVVHGYPINELRIDGANTIIDEWIFYAGAKNAAESVNGAKKTISIEELIAWNPDVIISGSGQEDIDAIMSDPAWANLTAVKNKKVYVNPKGVFMWDRYGTESALQIQWCASILYPELFEDFDIKEEVKIFYKEFMHYELTDEQIVKFLKHENP